MIEFLSGELGFGKSRAKSIAAKGRILKRHQGLKVSDLSGKSWSMAEKDENQEI